MIIYQLSSIIIYYPCVLTIHFGILGTLLVYRISGQIMTHSYPVVGIIPVHSYAPMPAGHIQSSTLLDVREKKTQKKQLASKCLATD